MKKTAQGFCLMLMFACAACGGKSNESGSEGGQAIDTSVVEMDTNSVDTRKNIELSDPQKQAVPGQSDTISDEK